MNLFFFLHVFRLALALHKSENKNQSKMFTQKLSQDVSMNEAMQIPDIDKCILFRSVENFSGCQCCQMMKIKIRKLIQKV